MSGDQVHVAAPFADAVDGALGVIGAGADGGQRVGDGQAAVVVGVDADLALVCRFDAGDGLGD